MVNTWVTIDTGAVRVNGELPTLDETGAVAFDRGVWRWRELAQEHGAQHRVPPAWVLAVIYAESRGDPLAMSPVGAVGLMQLHHPSFFEGRSEGDLLEPALNVHLGTQFLGQLRARLGDDLPSVASAYNAGLGSDGRPHPSPSSPWRMRENAGYIERVVRAHNHALGRLRREWSSGAGASAAPDRSATLGLSLGLALLRWWLT